MVGGGNSGVEEGLFLSRFADRIRLVEYLPELKASALLQDKIRSDPRFDIHTNTEIVELPEGQGRALGTRGSEGSRDGRAPGSQACRGLRLHRPRSQHPVPPGRIELDERGFVVTDERFMTSMAGVFAAGDIRAGSPKQPGVATGEGIAALLEVREYLRELEATGARPAPAIPA